LKKRQKEQVRKRRKEGREGGRERSGVLTFSHEVLQDGKSFRDGWLL